MKGVERLKFFMGSELHKILLEMDEHEVLKISNEYGQILKMRHDEVSKILDSYGASLEANSGLVAPVSVLPYSKEKIKQALKFRLLGEYALLIKEGKPTKVKLMGIETTLDDLLHSCYVDLAKFIDDKQAHLFKKTECLYEELQQKEKTDEEICKALSELKPKLEVMLKTSDQVNKESEALREEFALYKAVGMYVTVIYGGL